MKIVINACYGGFSVSKKVAEHMAQNGSEVAKAELDEYDASKTKTWYGYGCSEKFREGYDRSCPLLVAAVEALKEEANSDYSKLKVVEVPDGVSWEIDEYDGYETIKETCKCQHRSWD